VYGETIPSPDPTKRLLVLRQPVGVCAAITPWNFPLAMITRKVAPALAAGCPVVIKPAEQTPLTALAAAELAQRAGMPPGVLNMLTSDAAGSVDIGKVLCASPVVRHLSFTGSTEVGRILMAQSAPSIKKLGLELGGNAPFIVFDDADVDAAVEGAMQSKYRNAGQTCVCANRLYVQDGVYETFVQRLAERVAGMKVGSGFDEGVQVGPLIDDQALTKVQRHVDDALAKGARMLTGGKVLHAGSGGRFYAPTVLADAHAGMLCAREETFGPVAPVFRFSTEDEAIAAANATEFGLAGYFYSRDVGRIFRVGEALEYGIVGVNTGLISNEVAPFGGVKQSGLGREGSHHGIDAEPHRAVPWPEHVSTRRRAISGPAIGFGTQPGDAPTHMRGQAIILALRPGRTAIATRAMAEHAIRVGIALPLVLRMDQPALGDGPLGARQLRAIEPAHRRVQGLELGCGTNRRRARTAVTASLRRRRSRRCPRRGQPGQSRPRDEAHQDRTQHETGERHRHPPGQTCALRMSHGKIRSMRRGVVAVLRVIHLGEEVPALRQQSGHLHQPGQGKPGQRPAGAEPRAEQGQRNDEPQQNETALHAAHHRLRLPMEELVQIEAACREAARDLHDALAAHADGRLQAPGRYETRRAQERGHAAQKGQQRPAQSPAGEFGRR
jgi:succinate-semialdehyde dehydrogenase/glutarate-semialdehyde dehydrogenase